MSRKLKVAALQRRIGSSISSGELDRLKASGVDLICLPEYFFIPDRVRNQVECVGHRATILQTLKAYSEHLVGIVVGGSLIEQEGFRYYNACHVFDSGRYAGVYRKAHPTRHERDLGIFPGDSYTLFEVRGIRLAILICADVLFPEAFLSLSELKPDVIAVPTTSPYLPGDTAAEKERRDREIFIEGAAITGAHIVKACGVGHLMGHRLQGRSLICNPEGIVERVPIRDEALETILTVELEIG